jgi:NAD(P)H-hydrate epimerase
MTDSAQMPQVVSDVPVLPPRAAETHKGESGHVAIIAGSRGMSGAACLAGLGALRGGAGLVRVLTPVSTQPIVAGSEPSLMTVPLPETKAGQLSPAAADLLDKMAFQWAHVVAIGPGLGASPGPDSDLAKLVAYTLGAARQVVVDADALNAMPELLHQWTAACAQPPVLTPHPGEMARLRRGAGLAELKAAGEEARLRLAHEYAVLSKAVVVLKGHRTIVATPRQAYVNTTGNPGMATGGMGDVLTGLLAALLGQGLSPFDAARLAVYAHGAAADQLARQIGPRGYLAREVADALPTALAEASRPPIGFK